MKYAIVVIALALVTHSSHAQQLGRIEGVVTDSVHKRPLAEAMIYVQRLEPAQPEFFRTLSTDKDGRYRLDSLNAGRYSVSFTHAMLDSLELQLPPRDLALAAGERARVDFATPSGATLRLHACPGFQLLPGTGAVIGYVTDADTDRPLAGATIAVSWNDIMIDSTTFRVSTAERAGAVRVDSSGVYRICGAPTGSILLVQIQMNGRAGSALQTDVADDVGMRRLDLSFSAGASRSLVADSVSATDTTQAPLLTGTATVKGTIRSATGAPLSDVSVRVVDAAGSARTDSAGHFSLGALPGGSQLLEARRIGFLIGRQPLELRSGRTIEVQLRLDRIVSLDSIRVVAQRNKYKEFEQHRRTGFGRFFTEQQIAERHAFDTSDLFWVMPGLRVVGQGIDARVVSTRGSGFRGACAQNVVIDGMQNQDINLVRPNDIGAMEVYNDVAGGPPGANRGCGVIVIWTKR